MALQSIASLRDRLHEPGLAANQGQVGSPGQSFSSQTPVTRVNPARRVNLFGDPSWPASAG